MNINHSARRLTIVAMVIGVTCTLDAMADVLRISNVEPGHVMRKAATFEMTIFGSGFSADTAIKFFLAGTEEPGGIAVKRVKLLGSQELVATVELDSSVAPGHFDVEISGNRGDKARGKSLLLVEPYSWAARFGCTGAESWRLRIPCKRGTKY